MEVLGWRREREDGKPTGRVRDGGCRPEYRAGRSPGIIEEESNNMAETIPAPTSLDDWKSYFRAQIEKARSADMSDADRNELIAFVKREAEEIFNYPF
jgi:hypothetical protein